MILDDGGDATLLVHKGTEYEAAGGGTRRPTDEDSEEWQVHPGPAGPHRAGRAHAVDRDRRRRSWA